MWNELPTWRSPIGMNWNCSITTHAIHSICLWYDNQADNASMLTNDHESNTIMLVIIAIMIVITIIIMITIARTTMIKPGTIPPAQSCTTESLPLPRLTSASLELSSLHFRTSSAHFLRSWQSQLCNTKASLLRFRNVLFTLSIHLGNVSYCNFSQMCNTKVSLLRLFTNHSSTSSTSLSFLYCLSPSLLQFIAVRKKRDWLEFCLHWMTNTFYHILQQVYCQFFQSWHYSQYCNSAGQLQEEK